MTVMRRRISRTLLVAGIGLGALWLLTAPVASTRQGVNFQVTQHRIPFYVKAIDFLHRHYAYERLAHEVMNGKTTDEARALAVFDWTRRNIRPTPSSWPIVDDHILHIIIRGYGIADQMADVFCTLATYAGVPAFWELIRGVPDSPPLVLSFAKIDGAWRVFDVAHGVVFADAQGRLLDLNSLLADPTLVTSVAHSTTQPIPYAKYLDSLRPFTPPDLLRAEQQMPWPRLCLEVQRALHLGSGSHVEPDATR